MSKEELNLNQTEDKNIETKKENLPKLTYEELEKELKKAKREVKSVNAQVKQAQRFEEELKNQRAELDKIIDDHMLYIITDKDLNISFASQAFIDKFGYSLDRLKTEKYNMLIEQIDMDKFVNGCEYVASHGKESWGTDIKMSTIDNEEIETHTFIYPTFEAGVLQGFTFALDDISTKILLNKFQRKVLETEKIHASALDYVSSTSAAVLDTVSYKVSTVVKIVVSFIVLFLIYAVSFDIDEISRGSGQFIPTSKVQQLKNLEGGVVSAIFVHEGDSVKKGQVLLKLNPISYQSKLDENRIRMMELRAKQARLNAEVEGLPIDEMICNGECDQKMIDAEKAFYLSNKKELEQNILKQKEQLNYQRSALKDANQKFKLLEENYLMLADEFEAKKKLEKQKIFTRYELSVLERELNDSYSALKSSQEVIVQSKAQIQEIKNGIEETKLTFKNKAAAQLNETIAELLRLNETQKNLEDIIDRTVIRSPVNGVVKELFVHTIGSSIQANTDIISIVPDNYEMIAEVKMKPEEIAKLHIGQSVKLKVTAFDYSIYGDLEGKITNISPDTITDKDSGETHYLIYVKTKKNYLLDNEKYKIKVGMMVNADVLVGKKSIMSFLLKPILKTTQRD